MSRVGIEAKRDEGTSSIMVVQERSIVNILCVAHKSNMKATKKSF